MGNVLTNPTMIEAAKRLLGAVRPTWVDKDIVGICVINPLVVELLFDDGTRARVTGQAALQITLGVKPRFR